MFDFLTLSVVIDDRIFCVHGGAFWLDFSFSEIDVLQVFRLLYIQ